MCCGTSVEKHCSNRCNKLLPFRKKRIWKLGLKNSYSDIYGLLISNHRYLFIRRKKYYWFTFWMLLFSKIVSSSGNILAPIPLACLNSMFCTKFQEREVEYYPKVNKFFHRSLQILAPIDDIIKWRVEGGGRKCLLSKFKVKWWVFRDLLFVYNTLYGSKIDVMRKF